MIRDQRPAGLVLLCVVVAVTTAACSGSTGDDMSPTVSTLAPGATTLAGDVTTSLTAPGRASPVVGPEFHELGSPLSPDELESPLHAFLFGGFSAPEERFGEQDRLVAECMAQRGWTFHIGDSSRTAGPRTVGALLGWYRQYGYGLSTRIMLGVGADEAREVAGANEAYFESLTVAEREQYLVDLDGGVSDEASMPEPGSCRGLAALETKTPRDVAGVQEILRRSENDTFSHPEVQQGWRDWSACMLAKGYDFEYSGDAASSVEELWLETDGQEVERVQIYELRLASADYECRLVTWLPVQIRLEYDIVQQIVDAFPEYAHLAP